MKKLIVADKKIQKEETFVEGPITVRFRTSLEPNGEIHQIFISRDDIVIGLTRDQTESLVRVLRTKLQL